MPDNVTDGIDVVVVPLIIFVVPLNVWAPVLAVNVVALFVKLPAKTITAAAASFQIAPLFNVTSVLNVLVPPIALKLIVPDIAVGPVFTVNAKPPTSSKLPLFIVSPAHVAAELIITLLAPVVAIITSSVASGITPPTHVVVVAHAPPAAVLVLVAAKHWFPSNNTSNNIRIIRKNDFT